ncbi:MAG TPA: lipase family protein [Amycolatopsis sp.]|nr:lipase family protein [Amycolatopsis sp.]
MNGSRWKRLLWALIGITLVGLCSVASPASSSAATPVPPQNDPFYTPPPGYAAEAPGTVLRSREVQLAAFGVLPQNVQAWQLLYRTTGRGGRPMATVTTVVRPSGGPVRGLLSYQIAEDASGPQCAPSYGLRSGGGEPVGSAATQLELVMIDAAVSSGHAVSVPDWEGPEGTLLVPEQPGFTVLDGIRAAERFAPLGLSGASTPAAAWGYSGGSFATGWAAVEQASYAPELNLTGVAVGGFLTRAGESVKAVNGGAFAGFLPSLLPGMLRGNPELEAAFNEHLTPAGQRLLAAGNAQCLVYNLAEHPLLNMDDYLTIPFSRLMELPAVAETFEAMRLGPTTPKAPVFVYQAVHDELVPDTYVGDTVTQWCASGGRITYVRDEASEHATLMVTGAPLALNWLNERLGGAPVPSGCSTTTVPSTVLTPTGLATLPPYLQAALLGLLGRPLGVADVG